MRLRQRVRRAAPQRLRAFVRGDEAELAMPSVDELMLLLQAKRLGQGLQCVPHLLIAAWIAHAPPGQASANAVRVRHLRRHSPL